MAVRSESLPITSEARDSCSRDGTGASRLRVVVGMSGGVDSSVAAALLKDAGYDVIGMTMQIWHRSGSHGETAAGAGCCTVDAVDDARRVARVLDIPYYVPNFRRSFSAVIDNFEDEYRAGRTPNPCVRCNQFVRFDGLIEKASEVGADHIATGHYARVRYDEGRGEFVLLKAVDSKKDQSYVLHTLQQRHLSKLVMPLGDMEKVETRNLAREYALPVAEKPDSQELCFVAAGSYRDFLHAERSLAAAPGPILNLEGVMVGQHPGIHNFTVGQRRGLGIPTADPMYVVEIRSDDNTVVVGSRSDVLVDEIECGALSFTGRKDTARFRAGVRVRSHAAESQATVTLVDDGARVEFDEPIWGAAPGQFAVFYDRERVIGGGTIEAATKTSCRA